MYLSMVVFEECLAEYHPRMTGHSDLIKNKIYGCSGKRWKDRNICRITCFWNM